MVIYANEVMLKYIIIGILDTHSMKNDFLPSLQQKFRPLVHIYIVYGIKSRSKIYSEKPFFFLQKFFIWSIIN